MLHLCRVVEWSGKRLEPSLAGAAVAENVQGQQRVELLAQAFASASQVGPSLQPYRHRSMHLPLLPRAYPFAVHSQSSIPIAQYANNQHTRAHPTTPLVCSLLQSLVARLEMFKHATVSLFRAERARGRGREPNAYIYSHSLRRTFSSTSIFSHLLFPLIARSCFLRFTSSH